MSGAALANLGLAIRMPGLPIALVRDRLALRAAQICVGFAGRREVEADLRDAVHLSRPGDQPGPAGVVFLGWRRATAQKLSVRTLQRALPEVPESQLQGWFDISPNANPVALAAKVLQDVLTVFPRAEATALIMADAVLARVLGWDYVLPVLGPGLKPAELRKTDADLCQACYRAIVTQATDAVRLAQDLTRRAEKLRQVEPVLRAKGAGAAVARFLATDALSPSVSLIDLMSDRAARRLCDRLVALGAVKELTGRSAFRLYGL